jgi:hypothetical protein
MLANWNDYDNQTIVELSFFIIIIEQRKTKEIRKFCFKQERKKTNLFD